MERITSFNLDHDTLVPGMYVSKIARGITTYDIRMVTPNMGVYLDNLALHTFEHLFATYVRNTQHKDSIVYVGPMGCRTGFYFLTMDIDNKTALDLVKSSAKFISEYEGVIPGSTKKECGNYIAHDLVAAKMWGKTLLDILKDYNEDMMFYPKP